MPSIPPLLTRCLKSLEPDATFSSSGGSRIISSANHSYFAKIGSPSEAEQYAGESLALELMAAAAPGLAPRVLAHGVSEDSAQPYFVSQYLDLGSSLDAVAATKLGERLAGELHRFQDPQGRGFGFECPTHSGVTKVERGWFDTWEKCYSDMLRQLVDGLEKTGGQNTEVVKVGREVLDRVIPSLLGKLKVDPVLLHGDLWSGNAGVNRATGEPAIFDPAALYGHNEFELGIARMFGGFPPSLFRGYLSVYPPAEPKEEFEQRASLYEVYHYLNHALIFGGGYGSQATSRMKALLRYVDGKIAS